MQGRPIAAVVGKCPSIKGAPAKQVREMCIPARRLPSRYYKAASEYVLHPTAKAEAFESLKGQLKLISRAGPRSLMISTLASPRL